MKQGKGMSEKNIFQATLNLLAIIASNAAVTADRLPATRVEVRDGNLVEVEN